MKKINYYYPEDYVIGRNPVLVYLHPGGWRSDYSNGGCDSADNDFIKTLTDYGLLVVIPAYSLSDETEFNDGIDSLSDIHAAVTHLMRTGHTRIFMSGYSAGGHLALIYSLRFPGNVEKVVTIAAPSDLQHLGPWADITMQDMLNDLVTQFARPFIDLTKPLSPVYRDFFSNVVSWYQPGQVQFRLIYNTDDDCVNYQLQGADFANYLETHGFNVDLYSVSDPIGKHTFVYRDPEQVLPYIRKQVLQGMLLAPSGPTTPIYYIDDYKKRWIPDPETYIAAGFEWDDFIRVSQTAIDSIPTGEDYTI